MKQPLDDIDYWTLSVADRLVLVQDILDSVLAETRAEPLTPQQTAEMERRDAEADAALVEGSSWESVRARLTAER
ncbi:MAG: addiction module protein [Phycisphaerae bacterium]|jgi:putative addiction module component (TIGR02574 family)|nr:addiction module protein [Phycisphaerae bacterium]MCZ2400038.1 addiction module protein [Phycisphaerae bacterium]